MTAARGGTADLKRNASSQYSKTATSRPRAARQAEPSVGRRRARRHSGHCGSPSRGPRSAGAAPRAARDWEEADSLLRPRRPILCPRYRGRRGRRARRRGASLRAAASARAAISDWAAGEREAHEGQEHHPPPGRSSGQAWNTGYFRMPSCHLGEGFEARARARGLEGQKLRSFERRPPCSRKSTGSSLKSARGRSDERPWPPSSRRRPRRRAAVAIEGRRAS